jgi:DNA-binding transcriptional regulator YiaG
MVDNWTTVERRIIKDMTGSYPVTPQELRTILQRLGLTQAGAAAVLGVSERAVRAWADGYRNVPAPAQKLLRLMLEGTVTAEQVQRA